MSMKLKDNAVYVILAIHPSFAHVQYRSCKYNLHMLSISICRPLWGEILKFMVKLHQNLLCSLGDLSVQTLQSDLCYTM